MKAFIVEDERMLLMALTEEFKKRDWGVESATDGAQALTMIHAHHTADVVVLDLVLPKVDGFEVLRVLKADPLLKKIPVVVLTNLSDEHTIAAIIASGGTDYLVKSDYTLQETVQKIIEIAQRPKLNGEIKSQKSK